ncbi:sensor histidine kinase [Aeromicrobium sp. CF4.19]|uniref:sensor histidine kinase n=1 Tax=Aeromicrobium sp. CF4.19 TaxID=3373082 RepID=UPI003EE45D9C
MNVPAPRGARARLRRTSVRARTTAAAVVVVAVVLVLGAVAVVLSLRGVLTDGVASAAEQRAEDVATRIEADGLPELSQDDASTDGPDDAEDAVEEQLGEADDEVLLVLDGDGTVLLSLGDDEARVIAAEIGPRRDGDDGGRVVVEDEEYTVALADARTGGAGGDREVQVVVARPLEDVAESVATLALLLAIGVPVALVLIGATTWVVVGRALWPVEQIRIEAAAIDGARLHHRVPEPDSDDEIGRLARTVNLMLDRLETSARRQRQLVADTSHELRSPIASIRQSAEIAEAHPDALPPHELSSTVLAEAVRMQGIVDDLLLLARADERDLRLRASDVDLDDLVYTEARRLRPQSIEATSAIEAVRTTGDGPALARMLRNLVDNAVRHARGRVHLELVAEGDEALLAVEDDGTGVPEVDRERVFERFVRLDAARARDDGGSGLGLAIVQEIVAAHHGDVRVVDGSLGGARFEVRLPRRS